MSKANPSTTTPETQVSVWTVLEHTAEAMELSSDPKRRAAAAAALKVLRRELARVRSKATSGEQEHKHAA